MGGSRRIPEERTMGFFDFVKSMFGIGGCSMELELDADRVTVGGGSRGAAG